MGYWKLKKMLLYVGIICGTFGSCYADEKWYGFDHLYLQGGTYTHTQPNPDYDGPNLMLGVEAIKSNDKIYGIFIFDNSFGQFSQYAYVGKKWNFSGSLENFHARLTAGVIHGYKEPWNDKLPLTTKNGCVALWLAMN